MAKYAWFAHLRLPGHQGVDDLAGEVEASNEASAKHKARMQIRTTLQGADVRSLEVVRK